MMDRGYPLAHAYRHTCACTSTFTHIHTHTRRERLITVFKDMLMCEEGVLDFLFLINLLFFLGSASHFGKQDLSWLNDRRCGGVHRATYRGCESQTPSTEPLTRDQTPLHRDLQCLQNYSHNRKLVNPLER